jgi:hypothetical protein
MKRLVFGFISAKDYSFRFSIRLFEKGHFLKCWRGSTGEKDE